MSQDKYRRRPVRRQLHHCGHLVIEWLAPVASTLLRSRWVNVVRHLPDVPTRAVPRLRSPVVPWTAPVPEPPAELRTVPGIHRDLLAEQDAYQKAPLHNFFVLHADAVAALGPVAGFFLSVIAATPRVDHATRKLIARQDAKPARTAALTDPRVLTAELKKYAARLGLSATGVTAFTSQRKDHRGIVKAKINTKRCLPVIWQSSGCSICMKVCPVQRYGLPAVLDEYRATGRVLGKDIDGLEGFDWPLDGRHYGPGQSRMSPTRLCSRLPISLIPRTMPVHAARD
jgi:hypothetical protein